MAGVNVGTAYLEIIPSARGFAGKLQSEIAGGMSKSGEEGGRSLSGGIKKALSGAARDAGVSGDKAGGHFASRAMGHMKGIAAAAAGAFAVKEVISFGKDSIAAFTDTTKAATGMQRAIGGSIEDASRLNFAAKESGVSQQSLANSLKLLEKNMVGIGGKAPAGAKALASIGINAKDASGHMKPMSELLPDIAEKFKDMPNGAEKSAIALKLFGRGGLEMLPMLNKGKDGISDLMKESDKFGLTIGGQQVDAVKKSIVAQRQWHAALEGVKVQVGAQLLPLMTAFAGSFRDKLMPEILKVTKFLMDNRDAIANVAGIVIRFLPQIVALAGAFKGISMTVKAFTIVQGLLNVVMAMNPIGIVVIAIAALAAGLIYAYKNSETFRAVVDTAFKAIAAAGRWLWNNVLAPVIRFIVNGFGEVADKVGDFLDALSHIPGFGWAKDAADKMHGAAAKAREMAKAITDIPDEKQVKIETTYVYKEQGKALVSQNDRKLAANGIDGKRASGGPVHAGGTYLVGEREPELFVPNVSGTIMNQAQIARASGVGGGIDYDRLAFAMSRVQVNANVSPSALDRTAGVH